MRLNEAGDMDRLIIALREVDAQSLLGRAHTDSLAVSLVDPRSARVTSEMSKLAAAPSVGSDLSMGYTIGKLTLILLYNKSPSRLVRESPRLLPQTNDVVGADRDPFYQSSWRLFS